MLNHKFLIQFLIFINALMLPSLIYAQKKCAAPELSKDQIHEIVVRERKARKDIPSAFPKYEYTVRKKVCHYVYIEYGLPSAPEYSRKFMLNQFGVIVDVTFGLAQRAKLKCPEKVFAESELAEIIKKEREIRQDLPPLFLNYKVRVHRDGCVYFYFEYNLTKKRGDWQAFQIDPYGEIMGFVRN